MAFVFYDTETTGTETSFDQILQFAAIKTDDDLHEVERFQIRCRLLPHVIPSPGALKTNRITPAMLLDPTLPSHYEAMRRIRQKLVEWSPAIFIGYNSLPFDEDLLRQGFFKTLHPVYLTNTGGNTRADALRMVRAASIYAPNSIAVPLNDKGKSTFALDKLAPANGYQHASAHEALADVEATIHIAKMVKDRTAAIWNAMLRNSRKSDVREYLERNLICSYSEYYGRPFSWLVTFAGGNPDYDAQLAVFDLAYDPQNYLGMSADELIRVMNSPKKAIRAVRANAQPMLMAADSALTLAGYGISAEELQRRAALVRSSREFQQNVGRALAERYGDPDPKPLLEHTIYTGFPSRRDERSFQEFHRTDDWAARGTIVSSFEDDRYRQLAHRLIHAEVPGALPASKQRELNQWVVDRLLTDDETAVWTTIPAALREVKKLLVDADPSLAAFLRELRGFYKQRATELAAL